MQQFETKDLPDKYDTLAPDGSEIRLLPTLAGCSMAHCTLAVGKVSRPIEHKRVSEIWYILEGEGQVWRKQGNHEAVVDVRVGVSLTIPVGTQFQFRTTSNVPLRFIISTIPPWPGADEAVMLNKGKWDF